MMGRRKMMRAMRGMSTTTMVTAGILGIGIATAVFMGMRNRNM